MMLEDDIFSGKEESSRGDESSSVSTAVASSESSGIFFEDRIFAAYATPGLRSRAWDIWSSLRMGTTTPPCSFEEGPREEESESASVPENGDDEDETFSRAALASKARRYRSEASRPERGHEFNCLTQRWEGAAVDLTGFDFRDDDDCPGRRSPPPPLCLPESLEKQFLQAQRRHDQDLRRFLQGADQRLLQYFARDAATGIDETFDDDGLKDDRCPRPRTTLRQVKTTTSCNNPPSSDIIKIDDSPGPGPLLFSTPPPAAAAAAAVERKRHK